MERQIVLIQEEPRGPSQLVEIQVTQAGITRVQLPDVQQLRSQVGQDVIIKAVRLITPKVLTNGAISGFVNAPLTELVKISLVLYAEGWEKGHLIPLLVLNDVNDSDATAATTIPFRNKTTRFDNWKNVDWSKSYLQFSNGTAAVLPAGASYVVMLDVEYTKLNAQGKEIVGPS